MLTIVGTVPERDFPLGAGEMTLEREELFIGKRKIKINRGTPALVAAAIQVGNALGQERTFCFLVGDAGLRDGSRRLYEHLRKHLGDADFSTFVFRYLQPDIDGHNGALFAIKEMAKRSILIADADNSPA